VKEFFNQNLNFARLFSQKIDTLARKCINTEAIFEDCYYLVLYFHKEIRSVSIYVTLILNYQRSDTKAYKITLTFRLVNLPELSIKSVFQFDYEPTPCFHIQNDVTSC